MSIACSMWAAAALQQLANEKNESPLYQQKAADFFFEVKLLSDSLWVIGTMAPNSRLAFRTAFAPDGFTDVQVINEQNGEVIVRLRSAIGEHNVDIKWVEESQPILRYTATLKPSADLMVPFWPRDIIAFGKKVPKGEIHVSQVGTRSGLIYSSFKEPGAGSFLYFQDLGALGDYNNDTETSAGDTVGGQWPEMGLSLAPALNKPMQHGKTYTVSDAFVAFNKNTSKDQFDIAKGFLEALCNIYLLLPQPETKYQDYIGTLPKALNDLQNNKGCWSHRSGHPYLNAYLCDYQTPPEIMVQLAVLLPVQDHMHWSGEQCPVAKDIIYGLSAFYNEKLGTVMRWLPSEEDRLDRSEEQKIPLVMDSWYLHHPLLNLARLAGHGIEIAKDLLLRSIDYAIKVAHHFNYCWPVFYKMDTLEVIKPETKPGEGGEKDVAGLYAHVMLQVWELTKDQKYFREAEKAARSMVQHGFNVFYQANNTMFAAKAMILLYKETKEELYRDLTYLFVANIFKNVALWECKYGFGKNFPSFFQLFPLNDAPYTAVYEEQEVFSAVHEFFTYASGAELMPAVPLLLAEFTKHAVNRMIFYYPPMLPKEMLAKEVKTGELDPELWVALEDIHDGWEPSGGVGQEVYGAGLAFGIVPRQYIRIPDQDFIVFVDYPVLYIRIKGNKLKFDILGDPRSICRLLVLPKSGKKTPRITLSSTNDADQKPKFTQGAKMHECVLHGGQAVTLQWN